MIDSEDGQGVSWAMDCIAAGHDVKMFIKPHPDGTRQTAGDGYVPKVADYHKWLTWADLIFPTGNASYMQERDKLIEEGFPIFGAGTLGTKLEIDRAFAMKLLERKGVEMIPYHEFNNLTEAQAFIHKNGGMYVVKTLGSEADKSLTHVPSHKDYAEQEIISMFDKWKKQGKMNGKIMLQEFWPGIEVGVSCFFGPGGWSKWRNTNFEHKKLLSKNFGPNTGEMGTVTYFSESSKIFDKFMLPMTEYLHAVNYVGDLAVNCIVNGKGGMGFLEWTARSGWPYWHGVQETIKSDPAEWMLDLINGKDTIQVSTDVCVMLVMAHPNFPYTSHKNKDAENIPVFGITPENKKHLHFVDMKIGKGPLLKGENIVYGDMPVTSGEYAMVISGKGKTVRLASKKAYDIADYIGLPGKIVRDDVGEKLRTSLPELHKHGIATEIEYE